MEAGPAELVRFDERDLETQLRGPDTGRVTAHPSAEDGHVKIEIGHWFNLRNL